MQVAQNCAKKCKKRLVVWICAANGLKCEYVRETTKSAILHPPHLHLFVASVVLQHRIHGVSFFYSSFASTKSFFIQSTVGNIIHLNHCKLL